MAPAEGSSPTSGTASPVSVDEDEVGDGDDASDATAAAAGSQPLPPVAAYYFSSAAAAVAGGLAAGGQDGGRRRKCWSLERGVGASNSSSIGMDNGNGNGSENLARMAVVNGGRGPISGGVGGHQGFASMQVQQRQNGREWAEVADPASAAAFEWRRRSRPPDFGTAAVAYSAQQRQQALLLQGEGGAAGSSGGSGAFGVRPLDVDTSDQQLRQQRRRLESFGGGEHHYHRPRQDSCLFRSFSPGQRQSRPPLPLPLLLPLSARPWSSSAPGPGPAPAAAGGGAGGERWPRAPIADGVITAGLASSSAFGFGSAPATALRDGPLFLSQHRHQHHGPGGGSDEGGADGNSSSCSNDTATTSATTESAGFAATGSRSGREDTPMEVDRSTTTATWADAALKSRLLPMVNNLLPSAAATAARRNTSAATLNPQWRGGLPRSRSLFSFRGRTGDGGGGGGNIGVRSSSPWWPSFRRGAAEAAGSTETTGAGAGAGPTPPLSPTMAAPSWGKSSSVVTLHGGRNSHKRLARLSTAAAGGGDGAGSLGPTLETLELVS